MAHADDRPDHPGGRIKEIFNQLGLTDDQKQQLQSNKEKHHTEMDNEREQLKINREALRQELMKPQLDMSKVKAIHHQIKLLLAQTEDTKLNSILAVRTILTQEQFIKFTALMHKFREESPQRHEHDE